MQISVERIDDLNRKLIVQVPEATIRERVEARLKSLASQTKIAGFRPGKVPATLVRQRYGKKVREEVLGELIESSFSKAVQQEKLKPAGLPQITAKGGVDGQGFEYEAAFEVFPDFVPMPVEALEVTRYVSAVAESDVDLMLERLREQRQTWHEVERGAELNDRLIIAIEGSVGGERLGEGRLENFPYILGGKQLFPGFGEQLLGARTGEHRAFDLEFPSDGPNPRWAGKKGHFEVDVTKIERAVLPELDADFARAFGIEDGDLDAFRRDVRQNMEREMNRALKTRTKSAVMDVLMQKNNLTLPNALVEAELKSLIASQLEAAAKTGKTLDEAALRQRYEGTARRRVALGLILNKLIELNQMKANPKTVREAVEDIARSYEQPEQIVHWYYSNAKNLQEVENVVIEDQVIDWILDKAVVREETIAFQELIQSATNG